MPKKKSTKRKTSVARAQSHHQIGEGMPTTDAITQALITGNEANAILEQVDPDLASLKDAQKLYKKAAKTIGAAIVLLAENCNKVKPEA